MKKEKKNSSPGEDRTPDLRMSPLPAITVYKYDALTDCATGEIMHIELDKYDFEAANVQMIRLIPLFHYSEVKTYAQIYVMNILTMKL